MIIKENLKISKKKKKIKNLKNEDLDFLTAAVKQIKENEEKALLDLKKNCLILKENEKTNENNKMKTTEIKKNTGNIKKIK